MVSHRGNDPPRQRCDGRRLLEDTCLLEPASYTASPIPGRTGIMGDADEDLCIWLQKPLSILSNIGTKRLIGIHFLSRHQSLSFMSLDSSHPNTFVKITFHSELDKGN